MKSKRDYTREFLSLTVQDDIPDSTIDEYISLWWMNRRDKSKGGLRLTRPCIKYLIKHGYELYTLKFDKLVLLTSRETLTLDNMLPCPYYLTDREIVVTSMKVKAEIVLYGGELKEYIAKRYKKRTR